MIIWISNILIFFQHGNHIHSEKFEVCMTSYRMLRIVYYYKRNMSSEHVWCHAVWCHATWELRISKIWQVFFNPPQNSWHRFMHSRRTSNPHWNVSCLLTGPQNQTWLTTWSVWGLANPKITRNVSYQVRKRKITVFWNLLNPTSSSDLGPLTLLGKSPKWDPKNLTKSSKLHSSLQERVSCWILGYSGLLRFAKGENTRQKM